MKHRFVALSAILAVLMLGIFAAGCTGTQNTTIPQTSPTLSAGQTPDISFGENATIVSGDRSVVLANNRFTRDLYLKLAKATSAEGDNIFFSPFSISSALAITYEGARGPTADEIRSVFYFPKNTTRLREGFASVNAGINTGDAGYTLSTANALWAEKTYAFLPEYISTAEQYYAANTTNLDFISQPEASRQTINSWVEDKTYNKIKDLLPSGSITPLTRLVITNAVYFKGTWQKQFDANKTVDAPFRTAGTTVTVRMMQRTDEEATYPYVENADLQVLSLPYTTTSGKGLSMLVLLPKNDDLSTIDPYLDPVNLSALTQSQSSRRVMVFIPKFKIETMYSLPKTLGAMGMPTAFSDNADFSGMDGSKMLYISDVIHKAYIELNEEGTEAAAATAVVIWAKGVVETEPSVPVFRADHPFVFLIQDNNSGTILFAGRVTNPGSN
ncbi:MAG: serpin family protein [Methanoregula sp.]